MNLMHEHITPQQVKDFLDGKPPANFKDFAEKHKTCSECADRVGEAWQRQMEDRQNAGATSMG